MARNKKDKDLLKRTSKIFLAALDTVGNMKDTAKEPLPGRTPSKAFHAALRELRKSKGKK